MDELLRESRLTNAILRLAFRAQIADTVTVLMKTPSNRVILQTLATNSEMTTGELLAAAARSSVARRTVFTSLEVLDQAGLIDRSRRGIVALSPIAMAHVRPAKVTSGDEKATNDVEQTSLIP